MMHSNHSIWEWEHAKAYIRFTGGHPPSHFAKVLATAIQTEERSDRLLDLGCGSGIIGIYALVEKVAASATFVDVQEGMVLAAKANLDLCIAKGTIRADQVDYLTADFNQIPLSILETHDLIAFNPPQLPEAFVNKEYLEALRQDRSGAVFRLGVGASNPDGLNVIRSFLDWYASLPATAPQAVIGLSGFLGRKRIERLLNAHRLDWTLKQKTRIPLRTILTQAAYELAKDELEKAIDLSNLTIAEI